MNQRLPKPHRIPPPTLRPNYTREDSKEIIKRPPVEKDHFINGISVLDALAIVVLVVGAFMLGFFVRSCI